MSRPSLFKSVAVVLCGALWIISVPTSVTASVFSNGNVILLDDVGVPISNATLPVDGNFIDLFVPDPPGQIFYEGIVDIMNAANPFDDTNRNVGVLVGQTSFGVVLVSGESALRDLDLIIGDIGTLPNGQMRRGTGVVRITGFGSVFNNDPNIFPLGLTSSPSPNPRPLDVGFDVYVGRGGTGTLEISLGGRAEIQDAVIVADQPGSTGTLIVDGFDSFLGSGGADVTGGPLVPHAMIIGRRGFGYMTIQNGGQVAAEAPTGGDDERFVIGAVIGSDAFDNQEPEPGGQGTVTVTGLGSKWIIGGSLQVGGFDDADEELGIGGKDFEGDNVLYSSEAGRGTLNVQEGGIVNVILSAAADAEMPGDLLFVIGRFGRVELNGGYISVGVGELDGSRTDDMQVINDGLIQGAGRIDTGVFRNRYLGRVHVGPTQRLIIDSSSEFLTSDETDTDLDDEPLINFGLVEVLGTADARAEIEFLRAPSPEASPIRPFINRPLAAPGPGAFDGGLISAQHATLRFQSGIMNEGTMGFTAGTNIISGKVDNISGAGSNGRFLIFPNTTVVIEDDFTSGGIATPMPPDAPILTLREGGTLIVLDQNSFTLNGHLDMQLSFTNPSKIQVSGDVGLNGDLYVSFDTDTIGALSHGDAFELLYFAGFIGGVDDTDPLRIKPDLTVNPVLNVVPSASFDNLYPNLDLITVHILQSFYLFVLDPSMVGPPGGPGATSLDPNGDGVVDLADLAIWQANVGITMGASVLQGDFDGDGDVDGNDFLVWQANIGPVPGAGAGAGSSLATNVPEPAGLMLLLGGGMLAMTMRPRRGARIHC